MSVPHRNDSVLMGEQLVERRFEDLLKSCEAVCKQPGDLDRIREAFDFANHAHSGVKRKSGEPYIVHPIAVAKIVVCEVGLGVKSVQAALLHDVVEDTHYTVEDLSVRFGEKVARMVEGLTKLSGVVAEGSSLQAENFKKMLLTLSDDVRVIIIKLADRLHNMRTLGSMPQHKQMKIAGETIYLFAPLAHRLGLYSIKSELEDLSLKYRFPEEYNDIVTRLKASDSYRQKFIESFNAPLIAKLKENDIDFEISGRVKSIYSIWKKMKTKAIPFDEIYDLFAIRIVFKPSDMVPEKSQCWHIYSLITDVYKSNHDRLRDWVNTPKANGYEALHCTLMGPGGVWAEVQIRSVRMNDIAERGFAAHWRYKANDRAQNRDAELDIWLEQLREALENPVEDAGEFLDSISLNLQVSEIMIFTPKGDSRAMPKGSTVLDFAYEIHSKVGNHAIGARINHKLRTIFTTLNSGDQVEILTSEGATPQYSWISQVKTAKARNHIRNYLRRNSAQNIKIGKDIFINAMSSRHIKIQNRIFEKLLPAYDCSSREEFYNKLGMGAITLDNVDSILKHNAASKLVKYWTLQLFGRAKGNTNNEPKSEVSEVDGTDGVLIAECCRPIPGDLIVGFKDASTGMVTIHKKNCVNAIKLAAGHGENIVEVKWSREKAMSYLSIIELRGMDRMGILMEVSKVITGELNVNIRALDFQSYDGVFDGRISLYVRNNEDLHHIMKKVQQIKGVDKVVRIENTIAK